jgi:Uma2 family endonuclease
MAHQRGKPATYADLERLPENLVGEILDGELFASPRPATRHAVASGELYLDLGASFGRGAGGPGGWRILAEPELHLRRDIVVPDLAGWRVERMPRVPDAPAIELPPDWVCEVVSPSTARLDRGRKKRVYEREGVPHYWIVDPVAKLVEVLILENGRYVALVEHALDDKAHLPPFDAIELDLARWWLPDSEDTPPTPVTGR